MDLRTHGLRTHGLCAHTQASQRALAGRRQRLTVLRQAQTHECATQLIIGQGCRLMGRNPRCHGTLLRQLPLQIARHIARHIALLITPLEQLNWYIGPFHG
jgi:hypothetical protein